MNEQPADKKQIVEYVRDDKGEPRGVLLAAKVDGSVRLTWSYANVKAGDHFKRSLGVRIAEGRLHKPTKRETPDRILKRVQRFANRARRYFKEDVVYFSFGDGAWVAF